MILNIAQHGSRPHGNKIYYSFKGSDGEWYNTGTSVPPPVGSQIQFDVELNAKGYKQAKNIVVQEAKAPTSAVAQGAVQGAKSVNQNDYWIQRQERDIQVQKRIELQSCRNSAIALVAAALQAGAIPMPKKTDEQMEVIAAAVDHYTEYYMGKNNEQEEGSVDLAASGVSGETEKEAPKATVDWA